MNGECLTRFEQRFQAWRGAHPREWIATTDRRRAEEFIGKQTKKIVNAQLRAADGIIVSQDRISAGIDDIAIGVGMVADGIEGLAAAFDWGFSELIWHLEEQRTVLQSILEVVRAPLDTRARELRNRASDAYRSGWIDDALEDFLESEKNNRYDFTTHLSLGNIYLFHKKNADKALEYYAKAEKYSIPKSRYYASLALLHKGLVMYLKEDFDGAYEATARAARLCPYLSEAEYQCAQYCAKLGKYNEAIDRLRRAIGRDRNYCLKVAAEPDFETMRTHVGSLFKELRDQAENKAKKELAKTQEVIAFAESIGVAGSDKYIGAGDLEREAKESLRRGTLVGCWDAGEKARLAQKAALDASEEYLDASEQCISDQISRASAEKAVSLEKVEKAKAWTFLIPLLLLLGVHIYGYIATAVERFHRHVIEGMLCLIFGGILIGVCYCINSVILAGVIAVINWPVFYFLRKRKEREYGRAIELWESNLSKVRRERGELNCQYEQREE